ncbi:hypothetical protein TNCV_1441671 [Trichonephila clavipes]|uniref:Uncharacterized protein n=1 Tax=Trichonephila clavipes TaxID=2585209 RepID=A0A8X6V272_TRICX|nr:hypothetical protein TNCV_1441671 [Trichonephila clavipes]
MNRSSGSKRLHTPSSWSKAKCFLFDFFKLMSQSKTPRRTFLTDLVILNLGQVTRMTPKLATHSPNFHTTPTGKLSASTASTSIGLATRQIFSGTRIRTHDPLVTSS